MPTMNKLATSRKRKSTAPSPRDDDYNSAMAAGSISTKSQKEATSRRSKGFQVYTAPISRELHRGTISQCAPVLPKQGLPSGVSKARKSFPPVYHKSRIIVDAIRNVILDQGSQGRKETNAKPKKSTKQDLLVLSTVGTYWGGKETVAQQKAPSKIHQAYTAPSNIPNKRLPKPQIQVPQDRLVVENNWPKKQMPKLIPITKDMVFLPS